MVYDALPNTVTFQLNCYFHGLYSDSVWNYGMPQTRNDIIYVQSFHDLDVRDNNV